jgi:hypothetical protein
MVMNKGTVEYQDVILAITDVRLGDGAILITATGTGPLAEYHGPIRIYGPDGLLVQEGGHADCPGAAKNQTLQLEVTYAPELGSDVPHLELNG